MCSCSAWSVEIVVFITLLFRTVQATQLVTSATFARKATQEMPHRVPGQTVNCLDLFHNAGVTAEVVSEPIVQMVTSAFARFVLLNFKCSKNVC